MGLRAPARRKHDQPGECQADWGGAIRSTCWPSRLARSQSTFALQRSQQRGGQLCCGARGRTNEASLRADELGGHSAGRPPRENATRLPIEQLASSIVWLGFVWAQRLGESQARQLSPARSQRQVRRGKGAEAKGSASEAHQTDWLAKARAFLLTLGANKLAKLTARAWRVAGWPALSGRSAGSHWLGSSGGSVAVRGPKRARMGKSDNSSRLKTQAARHIWRRLTSVWKVVLVCCPSRVGQAASASASAPAAAAQAGPLCSPARPPQWWMSLAPASQRAKLLSH